MTDGTTGFHVAPITEDDMNRVTSILKRAMDTMIGASQLAADVDMLRQTVSGLQADADRLRNQNNALDEALNHSRAVRDDQAAKLVAAQDLAHENERVISALRLDNDHLTMQSEQYHIDLELTRKERDDAQFEALDFKDKLATAEAKLAKVKELHSALFPAEAKLEPVHAPEPYTPPPYDEPTPAVAESLPPDSQDHWDSGYTWDAATGKYWRHGVTPKPDGASIPGF